jgi:hypothetical protein
MAGLSRVLFLEGIMRIKFAVDRNFSHCKRYVEGRSGMRMVRKLKRQAHRAQRRAINRGFDSISYGGTGWDVI